MKNLKAKNWFFLILGAVGIIFFIAIMIMVKEFWWLSLIGIVACVIIILTSLKPMFQVKSKNNVEFVGKFLYIGLNNEFFIGGVFEVDGKERKVLIPKDVFSEKRLAPGINYKITENSKKDQAVAVERID